MPSAAVVIKGVRLSVEDLLFSFCFIFITILDKLGQQCLKTEERIENSCSNRLVLPYVRFWTSCFYTFGLQTQNIEYLRDSVPEKHV